MGEIVRVLKWRLDLDSAGMAEGVEKAATSAERLAKAASEVGDKGSAGLKKTTAAAKETETAFEGMGLEAKQVEMYLGRLEKGAGSPLVLQRNAELAGAAMAVLAAKSEAAGTALDSAFTGRVETAIAGAKEQAAGMNAELEKMGGQTATKLDKVITALEQVAGSAGDAYAAFEKLGAEGEAVANALRKMDAAKDSPRELQRNAALAEMAMNELKVAIDKAKASGVSFGPAVGTSVTTATAKITAANERAAKLRDTLGDMKTRGDLAAKGMEATAGAAGSLDGMLSRLIDTGGKTEQSLAKVGFSVLAISAAAKMGYSEGEKLRAVLVELGVPLPNLSDRIGDVVAHLTNFGEQSNVFQRISTGLATQLVNTAHAVGLVGRSYAELGPPEAAAMARAREMLALKEAQARGEYALNAALAKGGLVWNDVFLSQDKWLLRVADAEKKLAEAKLSQEEYDKVLKENAKSLKELGDGEDRFNIVLQEIAPRVAAAIVALDGMSGAHEKGAAAAGKHAVAEKAAVDGMVKGETVRAKVTDGMEHGEAVTIRTNEAINEQEAAYEGSARAADDAANATRDHTTAVQVAETAAQGWGDNIDNVTRGLMEAGGKMVYGQPIIISYTQATQEMTDALLDAAVATGKLRAEQAQALDATKGWTDYVLAMKEGYDSGANSLLNYITGLSAFKTQITQMFGSATGDAKEAVTALQDLIDHLIATVGPRAPGSGNPWVDELEKAVAKGKGKK